MKQKSKKVSIHPRSEDSGSSRNRSDNFPQAEKDLLDMVKEAVQTEWDNVADRKAREEDFDGDYHRFVGIFNKSDYES